MVVVLGRIQTVASPGGTGLRDRSLADLLFGVDRIAQGRTNWDSSIYLTVAAHGYPPGAAMEAGFPGYALAMRGVSSTLGWHVDLAGIVLSAAAGLIVAVLLWRWAALVGLDRRAQWVALLLVLFFPPAFLLYGVVYPDGFALAAILGAFVLAHRERWALAGACGAVATVSRPNALPVIVLLVAVALERSGALTWSAPDGERPADRRLRVRWWARGVAWRPGAVRPRHAGVLLSAAGVGAYAVWLWRVHGNPLYFAWVQPHIYGHTPIWHPWAWLKIPVWRPVPNLGEWVHEGATLLLVVGALASLRAVTRRLGWPYAVYVVLVVVQSWLAAYDFAPARYLLPCVPVLAVTWAPSLARHRTAAAGVLAVSAATSMVLAAGFAGAFPLNW